MILITSSKRKHNFTFIQFGGNLKTYLISFHQALEMELLHDEVKGSANQIEKFYEISGYPWVHGSTIAEN